MFHLPETKFEFHGYLQTSEFYIVVPDSWLKFGGGSYRVSVFVCLCMSVDVGCV